MPTDASNSAIMTSSSHTLHFGDTAIEYTLTYAARKTLAIHVHPDRSVTVFAWP